MAITVGFDYREDFGGGRGLPRDEQIINESGWMNDSLDRAGHSVLFSTAGAGYG